MVDADGIIMNLLRKYIRTLLTEEEDMGKYAFPGNRMLGKDWPEHWPKDAGEEPNTPTESMVFVGLRDFLDKHGILSTPVAKAIIGFIRDGKYPEALQIYDKTPTLFRGMNVTAPWLRERNPQAADIVDRVASEWTSTRKGGYKLVPTEPFTFVRKGELRAEGEGSSWTYEMRIARRFALPGWSNEEGGIILEASTADNMFLDVEPFYLYTGLNEYQHEDELIALGDVTVNEILTFMGDDEEEDEY